MNTFSASRHTSLSALKNQPILLLTAITLILWLFAALPIQAQTPTPGPIPGPAPKPRAVSVPSPPDIDASSYILQDFHTGRVIAEKNADRQLPPASLTKLMTAYLVFEALNKGDIRINDLVTVSEKAWRMKGSRMFIEVNKQVPVHDLLQGMIIQSGNDAAVALAEFVAGSEDSFADLMNRKARRLGLADTVFSNSTGMPNGQHHSTTRDIARLSAAIIRDFPQRYAFYSEKDFTYNGIKQHNRNGLLWRDLGVDGLKTGYTEEAGYCLASSAQREGMRLISVVMGADSKKARETASRALLNYGFRFFDTRRLYQAGAPLADLEVWKSDKKNARLGLTGDMTVTIPRGYGDHLEVSMETEARIIAPVRQGQTLGKIQVSLDGQTLAEQPLVALEAVPEGGLWVRGVDSVLLWFK